MNEKARFLQFDNILEDEPISARCNACGMQFFEKREPRERTDNTLLRMRAKFDAHRCGKPNGRFYSTTGLA